MSSEDSGDGIHVRISDEPIDEGPHVEIVCTDRGQHPATSLGVLVDLGPADDRGRFLLMGSVYRGPRATKRAERIQRADIADYDADGGRRLGAYRFRCPRCRRDEPMTAATLAEKVDRWRRAVGTDRVDISAAML